MYEGKEAVSVALGGLDMIPFTFAKWLLIIGFTWPGALWLGSVIYEKVRRGR